MSGEVFVQIPDAPRYYVSNCGRVYSSIGKGRVMKPETLKTNKYLRVCLRVNDCNVRFMVHRLVATAFLPRDKRQRYVHHIDGDKNNNHVSNLVWVTLIQHLMIHGHAILKKLKNKTEGNYNYEKISKTNSKNKKAA